VDTVLSLLELTGYVVVILLLSMAVTMAVVKVLPSESAKQQKAQESSD
jgi:hypothetical protein